MAGNFSRLINVETLAKYTGGMASEDVILQYVECCLIPHIRSADNQIRFEKDEAVDWLWRNHTSKNRGFDIPRFIPISISPKHNEIPESISGLVNYLREMPIGQEADCSGVYFLTRGKEIVYVGQATSVVNRVPAHIADKVFDRVLYLPLPRAELNTAERTFIEALKPKYNKSVGPAKDGVSPIALKWETLRKQDVLSEVLRRCEAMNV